MITLLFAGTIKPIIPRHPSISNFLYYASEQLPFLRISIDGAIMVDNAPPHHGQIDTSARAPSVKWRVLGFRQKLAGIDHFISLIVHDNDIGIEPGTDRALACADPEQLSGKFRGHAGKKLIA